MDGYEKYSKRVEVMNTDPYQFASNKVSKQKYNAKKRGIDWDLDTEVTIKRIVRSKKCAISGRELVFEIGHPDSPSIDRKNSKKGYTSRNTRIVSTAINIAKNDLSEKDFIKMCCDVARSQAGWVSPDEPLIKD